MTTKELRENSAEKPVKSGSRWRVIVARPGQGSSGFYSEEMFRRDATKVVPAGGQSFINHGSDRNPKDMIGVYPEGSFWDENEKAVVADLQVFSHWEKFVDEVGPHCGMSLYAMGESDADDNVTAIIEDRMNGADLVARPGLIGSGLAEKLYESATAGFNEPSATVAQEKNGEKMDEELKAEIISVVKTAFASLVAEKETAREAEVQAKVDADAVETAATERVESFAAAVKAVDEADLLESQRTAILEAAKNGADVAPMIESAKAIKAEALESAKNLAEEASHGGRILGETATTYGSWGAN